MNRFYKGIRVIAASVLLLFVARAVNASTWDLQGQDKGSTNWSSGPLHNWFELDFIPCRVALSAGATNLVVTVNFDHSKNGTPGIENLFSWAPDTNVLMTTPVLTGTSTNQEWNYTFTASTTNTQVGYIYFYARLSAGAHLFGGSSLDLFNPPLQIMKPAAVTGSPDLTISKTGPTNVNIGTTLTYSVSFSNKVSTGYVASGVQISDTLPPGTTYIPGSFSGSSLVSNVTVLANQLVWDVANLNPGDAGTLTYQMQVANNVTPGLVLQNNVQIQCAQNDPNVTNNASVVSTTATAAPPVTMPDAYSVNSGGVLNVNASGVLSNDTDPMGGSLRALLVTNVASGTLVFNTNGSFVYTPAANFGGVVTFYYVATNSLLASQPTTVTINVLKFSAPTAASVSCTSSVPVAATTLAQFLAQGGVDSGPFCGQATSVAFVGDTDNGGTGCSASPLVITRTYQLTTGCGFVTNLVQSITIIDSTAPVITTFPANATYSCAGQVPAADNSLVAVTDNCANVTISHNADAISSSNCVNRFTISRTYVATDSCGNSTSATQTITVSGTTSPVITAFPADATYSCASAVPGADDSLVVATNSCGGASGITITHSADSVTSSNCANKLTLSRTYIATDACGNSSSRTQAITVAATTAPTITGFPTDATYSCANAVPALNNSLVTAIDGCGGSGGIVVTNSGDVITSSNCPNRLTITRTYVATDACGNSASQVQTITVNGTTAPTIASFPADATYASTNTVPAADDSLVAGTDNCGSSTVTVSHDADVIAGLVITRVYHVTDGCANVVSRTQTITLNGAPVVSATNDSPVNFGSSVSLTGNATDDGLPNGSTLTYSWSQVSGAGTASFADATALQTTASFSAPGTYVIQFAASDSLVASSTNLTVLVNGAPTVNAGTNQIITLPQSVTLTGSIADDGLPTGITSALWSKVSGSGTVSFADSTAATTTASFSSSGVYVLRLTANDGMTNSSSDITITANSTPSVSVTADNSSPRLPQTVSLFGNVSDDGLPNGALAFSWSKVSGPGTVTFSNPTGTNTTASFSDAGSYTLRLSADDSAAVGTADIIITVAPENHAPVVDAGTNQVVNFPNAVVLTGTVTDDGNPEGAAITATWTQVSGPGTLTFTNIHTSTTSATASQGGIYVLRLTADDTLATNSADVTIAFNRAPVAQAQSVTAPEGQATSVTLSGTDPDGDALQFFVTQSPLLGTLSGTGSNLAYTANVGTYGADSIQFYVTDGMLTSAVATVSIQVVPFGRGRTYTTDGDFQSGSLTSLAATNNQLRTVVDLTHFNYVWVPVQSRGTILRLDAETGRPLGEYRLYPDGRGNGYPSRVAIDALGNCWVGNERDNSVVMIATPESGWVDKNHNGVLDTSQGQGDILPWTNPGGVDTGGGTSSAQDELITRYVRTTDKGIRFVGVNRQGNVWVGGTAKQTFDLIDYSTGQILRTEPSIGRGGFGGFIDESNVLWSAGSFLKWNTELPLSSSQPSPWNAVIDGSFACAKDPSGNLWATYDYGAIAGYGETIYKFAPNGAKIGEFPDGSHYAQGIAIGSDGDVWVAYSHCGWGVAHLKNDGTLIGAVPTAHGPTAVSFDRKGRLWVSTTSGVVQRINTLGGTIGKDGKTPVGAVELTSPFLNGYLWTYGNFTGSASALQTQRGLWSTVFDSGLSNAPWLGLSWDGLIANDGDLLVSVATSQDGSTFSPLQPITLENSQPTTTGRYLKVVVNFVPSTSGEGPTLQDMNVGTVGWTVPSATPQWQISAGGNVNAYWPDAVQLKGVVWHSPHKIAVNPTIQWTLLSGPGTVTFDNATNIQPMARFSTNGTYHFRITANNNGEIKTDEMTLTTTPYNRAPWADAGLNLFVQDYTTGTAILNGSVRDDGLPLTNTLKTTWTQLFGPGTTTFVDSNSPVTSATFSTNGVYILQLTGDDGEYVSKSITTVRVGVTCTVDSIPGLQAWWQANATGDDHVNGNQAFLENGANYALGKVGAAFNFDGVNARASVGANPHIDLTKTNNSGFSVEFWINPNSFLSGSVMGWTNGVRFDRISGSVAGDTLRFYVTGLNIGQYIDSGRIWSTPATTNSWSHIAATYDRATGLAKIYLNGVLQNSAVVGTNTTLSTANEFYMGQVPGVTGAFKGQLDEVSLYSRVIDPEEIYAIFASGAVGKCPIEGNQAPVVSAGPDLFVKGIPATATLNGHVSDDGLPAGSSVRIRWSQLSGPGVATFGSTNSAVTSATFSTNGIYVLQLAADDGDILTTSQVEVRVETLCTVEDPQGLVAWWPGNNNDLEQLNGYDAIQAGGTSYTTNGKVASAFSFNGVNNYVWMPAQSNYDVGPSASGFTLEFWMNPTAFQNGGVLGWANGVRVERISGTYTGDGLRFSVTGTSPGQYADAPRLWTPATTNKWCHIALTYDRTLGQAKIYTNGVLVTATTVGTNVMSTAGDFYLGQVPGSLGFLAGALDEISIYKRPLNPEEVYNLFASGSAGKCPNDSNDPPFVYAGVDLFVRGVPGTTTLQGQVGDDGLPSGSILRTQWSMFSGPGSVAFADSSSPVTSATFSTNGTYVLQLTADDGEAQSSDLVEVRVESLCTVDDPLGLAAWWPGNGASDDVINGSHALLGSGTTYTSGEVATAFSFNGANNYVWMLAQSNYDVGSSASGFTLEFWMNPTAFQNGGVLGWANGVRVERITGTFTGDGLRLFVTGASPGQYADAFRLWTPATTNKWCHIALTYDRTLGQAKIYTNGVLVTATTVGTNVMSTAGDFYLGQVPGSLGFLAGALDEISIYKRPLNPEEVYNVFASGSAGKCQNDSNEPPIVYAGADRVVTGVPGTATLHGQVSDDGWPRGSTLRTQWSKFSGPGTATFADPNSPTTTATFSTNGVYVLQLTADDGEAQASDLVEVRVETLCTVEYPQGLAAWWPGNGASDDVINGSHALLGSGTTYTSGEVATAFSFNGANNYVWMLAQSNYDVGPSASGFTLEFWMNPTALQNSGVLGWANGVRVERISGTYTGDGLRLFVTGTSPGQYADAPRLWTPATTNKWCHIALTYDRTLGQAKIYTNGVLVTATTVGTNVMSTAGDFYLGQVPGSLSFLTGALDEISIYKRPLNPEEVYNVFASGSAGKCPNDANQAPVVYAGPNQTLSSTNSVATLSGVVADDGLPTGSTLRMQWSRFGGPGVVTFNNSNAAVTTATFSTNGLYILKLTADDTEAKSSSLMQVRVGIPCTVTDPSGLVAFWPGNGTSDDVINGYHAFLYNGTTYTNGEVATAFSFNGANNYVWMPAQSNFNVGPGPTGFTLEFWMNPTAFQSGGVLGWSNGVRVERITGTFTGDGLRFSVTGTSLGQYADAPRLWTSATTNKWCHIALTYDRTLGQARIFTNGAPVATNSVGTNVMSTAGDFYLGQVPGSVGFLIGSLDEVSLYNRPLALSEIQAVFNAGISGKCITPPNRPPSITAGGNHTIYLPTNTVTLSGAAFDDGLPSSTLSVAWNYASGPSTVFFSSMTNAVTTVTFTNTGVYTFQLFATDGQYSTNDTAVVTVLPDPRTPPAVTISSPANGVPIQVPNSSATATVNVTAAASDSDGVVSHVALFADNSLVTTLTSPPYTTAVSNLALGSHTFTAIATDNDGLSTTSAPVSVIIYVDSPPVATIFTPDEAASITAPTNIIGTASSPILQSYKLQYRFKVPEDIQPNPWTTLKTGTTSVVSNTVAVFDPTMLLNGIYDIQLSATDIKGRTASSEIQTLLVSRNLKVGNFTLSFTDLTVPLAGVPIQIIRTYDSRDHRTNDFGVGWSLDIRNVRLQKTRNLGANWFSTFDSPWYSLDSVQPRRITVTLAGDKAFEFEPVLTPSEQYGAPIESTRMTFTNLSGTYGKLEIDGDNNPDVAGYLGFISLVDLTTLDYFNPTLFKFTTAEGDIYIIDEKEGLKSLTDRNGNTLTITTNGIFHSSGVSVAFTRDYQGRITAITDPAGNKLNYTYGTNGSLVTFTDRETNTTTFAYTNAAFPNYLTSITDPRGVKVVRTEFDDSGRMVREIDGSGNVINFAHDLANNREIITDRLGNVTVHEYDDRGNVLRTTDALGNVTTSVYDDIDNELQKVDALGNTNKFTYDASGNKLTETDPLGYTTRYTYGPYRVLTSIKNARGFVSTNTYDPSTGNLLQQRDVLGNLTRYSYDGAGNLICRTDALGNMTSNRYDQLGQLTNTAVIDAVRGVLSSTAYAYDTNGNKIAKSVQRTTSSGVGMLVTQYHYDKDNRLVQTIYPDGSANATIYALGLNKPAIETDSLGRQTFHFYDERGNVTNTVFANLTSESTFYDAENRKIATLDRAGRTTFYTNDPLGRLTTVRLPDGAVTNTFYDAIGRIIATQDERGNVTSYAYDPNCGCSGRQAFITNALGQATHRQYDENANESAMADALGRTTSYAYDPSDRRTQVLFPDGTFTVTTYDALGRRIAETDQNTNTTWFGYDALSRLVAVTNALGKVTSYSYDELGCLTSQTDANNHTTTFQYDSLGRRTKRTLPLGQSEIYRYDAAGNLTNKVDFNGHTTVYEYDAVNRLLSKTPDSFFSGPPVVFTYTPTGHRATMTDASGATSYTYNSRDFLTNKTWTPAGQSFSLALNYCYNPHGDVTCIDSTTANGVDLTYDYDPLNRLADVIDAHTGTTTYGYDAVGNLAGYTYPNGLTSTYQYDSLNRLTNLSTLNSQTSTIANDRYTVAPSGHRLTASENVATTNGVRTINRVYSYDTTYRFLNESYSVSGLVALPPSANVGYTFDDVGNRLTRTSTMPGVENQILSYDANDRLTTDTYDSNGNTTVGHIEKSSPAVADQYDFEDRLINRNSGQVTIAYDGDGNRVIKTVGGMTTFYLVDDRNPSGYAQVLEELTIAPPSTPTVSRIYTYGNDLISQNQLFDVGSGPTWVTSFYGFDGHGSVHYLTSTAGEITDTYDYDAFGSTIAQTGTTPNSFRYCQEQFDTDLSLYYSRARYLDVNSGRFWTLDQFMAWDIAEPLNLHRYLYGNCDPVNRIDPTGYISSVAEVEGAEAVGEDVEEGAAEEAEQAEKNFRKRICHLSAQIIGSYKDMESLWKTFGLQRHHIYQQAKFKGKGSYNPGKALAIYLEGGSTVPDSPHDLANKVQAANPDGDPTQIAYDALIKAGCSPKDAKTIVDTAKEQMEDEFGIKGL